MKQCTKCKVEKELNQFQTYWHSTQQKQRVRGECTECLYKQKNERKRLKRKEDKLIQISIPTEIIQPVVPELEIEVSIDYSDNPDYKQCVGCKEYKFKTCYYKDGRDSRFNRCKTCIKKKDDEEREQQLIENGGSLQISPKPNTYKDKYQKELVFQFLPLCGWIFNEEKGMWWKPGFKDENGKFLNIKRKTYKYNKPLTDDQHRNMIMLKKKGMRVGEIAGYIGASMSAVSRWLKLYEQKGEKYRD